jgi:hypothetical protein
MFRKPMALAATVATILVPMASQAQQAVRPGAQPQPAVVAAPRAVAAPRQNNAAELLLPLAIVALVVGALAHKR